MAGGRPERVGCPENPSPWEGKPRELRPSERGRLTQRKRRPSPTG